MKSPRKIPKKLTLPAHLLRQVRLHRVDLELVRRPAHGAAARRRTRSTSGGDEPDPRHQPHRADDPVQEELVEHPEPDVGDAGEQVERQLEPRVYQRGSSGRPVGADQRRSRRAGRGGSCSAATVAARRRAALAAPPMAIPSAAPPTTSIGQWTPTYMRARRPRSRAPTGPTAPAAGGAGGATAARAKAMRRVARTGTRSRSAASRTIAAGEHGLGRGRSMISLITSSSRQADERGDGDRDHGSGPPRQVAPRRPRSARARRAGCRAASPPRAARRSTRGQPFTASNTRHLAAHVVLVGHEHRARAPARPSAATGAVTRSVGAQPAPRRGSSRGRRRASR